MSGSGHDEGHKKSFWQAIRNSFATLFKTSGMASLGTGIGGAISPFWAILGNRAGATLDQKVDPHRNKSALGLLWKNSRLFQLFLIVAAIGYAALFLHTLEFGPHYALLQVEAKLLESSCTYRFYQQIGCAPGNHAKSLTHIWTVVYYVVFITLLVTICWMERSVFRKAVGSNAAWIQNKTVLAQFILGALLSALFLWSHFSTGFYLSPSNSAKIFRNMHLVALTLSAMSGIAVVYCMWLMVIIQAKREAELHSGT